MPTLRHELERHLTGWRDHLAQSWHEVLGTELQLDFSQIPDEVTLDPAAYPVFPSIYKVFRALYQLPPDHVRFLLLGEDPYPDINEATGRSFEQGNLSCWVPPGWYCAACPLCVEPTVHRATASDIPIRKSNILQ